ncbi:hypothetical protein DSO57_1020236 [Entomophthora muscae]|uniref:Uncharacterized protein n=1 Tax=Entomophthora muscae TaxID=34485 RepID=A0ACC2SSZ2_9FUNG|nr:hypothetical protein DSO57_1020236 [Entomophthora muscae]
MSCQLLEKRFASVKEKNDNRVKFFSKNDKERARPGDLMVVESITNLATGRTSSFAGVCIAIHRSGPTTSITLRNVILKVGVEQKFRVFSPLIKSITRISPSVGFRRVKLYYLRDAPRKARLGMLKKLWVKQNKE